MLLSLITLILVSWGTKWVVVTAIKLFLLLSVSL
jgi:hypothetical protein